MLQIVHIYGMKVGPIKNGQAHPFGTNVKYNTIHVTDLHGIAFVDGYNFEAVAGGKILVRFKHEFIR